jgi:hypothetical protein
MVQLIMVEGIPGSGKSTTAEFVKACLEKRGENVVLYQEGNLDHPADFEQVAAVSKEKLEKIIKKWPDHKERLLKETVKSGKDCLIAYGKLFEEEKEKIPDSLMNELKGHDIYDGDVTAEQHQSLLLRNWQTYADYHGRESGFVIFECCFLQNPLCALLARFNLEQSVIEKHILRLEEAVEGLNPLLIYFDAKGTRETLEKVSKERPQEWLDFIVHYHTSQGYGEQGRLEGFDGLVKFMEVRQTLERDLLKRLSMPVLSVDLTAVSWEEREKIIKVFVDQHIQ